jgi:uncharacterized membrane protein
MTDGLEPPARTGGHPPSARAILRLRSTAGNLDYDRVLFFSDAVFAIAITLLAVDIRVPDLPPGHIDSAQVLRAAGPKIFGFAISFVVIGLFWISHHTMFRYITALDRMIIRLNLIFLGLVAFLPYPTALLSASSTHQTPATVFYASCVAVAALLELAIWIYAVRDDGLVSEEVSPLLRRYFAARLLTIPVVFGLSIPVAFAAPQAAQYVWIGALVIGVVLRRAMLRDKADETDS